MAELYMSKSMSVSVVKENVTSVARRTSTGTSFAFVKGRLNKFFLFSLYGFLKYLPAVLYYISSETIQIYLNFQADESIKIAVT